MTRDYQDRFGVTEQQLALGSVLMHQNASQQKLAHFNNLISAEQVIKSEFIADPIRQLNASPISDGAAAILLGACSPDQISGQVIITASVNAGDHLGLSKRKSLSSLKAVQVAWEKIRQQCSISSKKIDFFELHDCFSIALNLAIEAIGLSKPGESHKLIGAILKGEKPNNVNVSGGLKAFGHPVGASGVKQLVFLTQQLKTKFFDQAKSQEVNGLAENIGGTGATAILHLLKIKP